MTRLANPLAREPRYELVARVLRDNIQDGRLPHSLVLLEGPIAELMGTSRAPVQAALRQLQEEGLIRRFEGRGYLVGAGEGEPVRRDIRVLDLVIGKEVDEAIRTRGTWKHVYERVEDQIASCQVLGEFRIIEVELAEYLDVSRTVARDVLSRLHERGLIRKNGSSHWVAGPLTARILREKFELRQIMEPAALRLAAPYLRHPEVEVIRDRIDADPALSREWLEEALVETCLGRAPNGALIQMIRNNQLVLLALDRALTGFGLPTDHVALEQYRTLFDLIARQPIDSAAEFLRDHLRIMAAQSLARMKIVAVISDTGVTAPYLKPL